MTKPHDLVAVGNAIVDILGQVNDLFIEEQGMRKGAMNLIDAKRASDLYHIMPASIESSGGSASNTIAGFASFGGTSGFIGKVADDQLGKIFTHDLTSLGVTYNTKPLASDLPTAMSFIMITPDGERTMNTYLGATTQLFESDIDEELIRSADITYLEGYLFDSYQTRTAFEISSTIAHNSDGKVAFTLSDLFCVENFKEQFKDLMKDHIDILFGNEQEMMSLFETDSLETALAAAKPYCDVIAITRGKEGSIILNGGSAIDVPVAPVNKVIDTTGAGDLYAAGFLYGVSKKKPLAECGRLGALAAAEVISHIGPRPQTDLSELV